MRGLFRDKTKAEAFNVFRFVPQLQQYGYCDNKIILGEEEKGKRVYKLTPVVL